MAHAHTIRLQIFLFLLSVSIAAATVQVAGAQKIYALSGQNLINFDAQNPSVLTGTAAISGVDAGYMLAGIDFRPNTGQLYALGYNPANGEARLYTVNIANGMATPVGAGPITLKAGMGNIGFDFNPTVDRIRVTGSDNSNYRLHPVTGALVATDGSLAFAAGDANAAADPAVGAVAYTNSYIAVTATTLYNYDFALNILTTQIPPNNGTLNTVGASGLSLHPTDPSADMDIFFDPATSANRAFLAANTAASTNGNLYRIDLTTGASTLIGAIGGGLPVRNIAVFIDRTIPASIFGDLLYALTTGNNLISFASGQPEIIRSIVPVTGIGAGQVLSGLDFRPATGELYGIGYNTMNGEARLYTINPASGAATAIGMAPVTLAPGMGSIGFDFNPTVDRIRVTGSNNTNYRMHPVTGALAATDGMLAFAAGDVNALADPSVGAVAYTNSFNGTTTTTLYNYDDMLNVFTTQAPPNNGTLNTLGMSGIIVNTTDPSTDLDIYYDAATAQNRAYFSANPDATLSDNLYSVNLTTGAATLVGSIGFGIAVTDLAAFLKTQPTLSCPANITVSASGGTASAVVNYPMPTATSTCINGPGTATLLSGPASGSAFSIGDTEVCFAITDSCGSTDTCCFTVTVSEGACDVKTRDCLRFEVLSVRRDADGNEVYRLRVTNNCASELDYIAAQLPKGIVAKSPAQNATYTAPSGRSYNVRNPNFSPFYSIRFKTANTGIQGGQSDVFEYTLPKRADVNFIQILARLADGSGYSAHLNTFSCPIQPASANSNQNRSEESVGNNLIAAEPVVYPNPNTGSMFVDMGTLAGQPATFTVYSALGQAVYHQKLGTSEGVVSLDLSGELVNGAYYLDIRSAEGERKMLRFVVQR